MIFIDWSSIIVAVITGGMALAGVCMTNRRASALIAYRLQELEKKVQAHNNLIERTYRLEERSQIHEEKLKAASSRIADLEKRRTDEGG